MSTQVNPAHNLDALLVGRCEFSFSEGATTLAEAQAAGFLDVGNIMSITPKLDSTKIDHEGRYRSNVHVDKTRRQKKRQQYILKPDELNSENIKAMFAAAKGANYSQVIMPDTHWTAGDSSTGGIQCNSVSSLRAGVWYDVIANQIATYSGFSTLALGSGYIVGDRLHFADGISLSESYIQVTVVDGSGGITGFSGVVSSTFFTEPTDSVNLSGGSGTGFQIQFTRVIAQAAGTPIRNLTSIALFQPDTEAFLVEGTDYVCDLQLGRFRFTPEFIENYIGEEYQVFVVAPAITTGTDASFLTFSPLQKVIREGIGRLYVYDDDGVVMSHEDFACRVWLENAGEIDGTKWSDMSLTVDVLESMPGIKYLRQANENAGT